MADVFDNDELKAALFARKSNPCCNDISRFEYNLNCLSNLNLNDKKPEWRGPKKTAFNSGPIRVFYPFFG